MDAIFLEIGVGHIRMYAVSNCIVIGTVHGRVIMSIPGASTAWHVTIEVAPVPPAVANHPSHHSRPWTISSPKDDHRLTGWDNSTKGCIEDCKALLLEGS